MRNLVTQNTWELVVGGRTPEIMPEFNEEEAAIRTAKAKVVYDRKKAKRLGLEN
tara:strand:- start:2835 stop:2996 length:162 start_codon:yes stop_codon:yes gene_type:complete